MIPSAATASPVFVFKKVSLQTRGDIQCAKCPTLQSCPPCAKGQMCQLSVPASCADCPVNTCVLDPNYQEPSGGSGTKIGGALGGILAVFVMAGLVYWYIMKRKAKTSEMTRRARLDATLKTADGEKFRPGGSKDALTLGSSSVKDNAVKGSFVQAGQPPRIRVSRGVVGQDEEEEEVGDEDTEWTELREDGLTAYRKPPSGEELIAPDKDAKRRSLGAATHLSRITEGAEDDDEEEENPRKAVRQGETIEEEEESPYTSLCGGESRSHSSSPSIGSESNQARSRKSKASATFTLNNPFSDASDAGCMRSLGSDVMSTSSVRLSDEDYSRRGWSSTSLEPPSPAHRAIGAPMIDLQGKSKPKMRSAPRPLIESPLTSLAKTGSPQPLRPARRPDLNLCLDEEPAPLPSNVPSGLLSSFRDSDNFLSPAAPSTSRSQLFDVRRGTRDSTFPSNELLNSAVYRQNVGGREESDWAEGRHLSMMTASSGGTLAYILSTPQIVAVSEGAGGVQRMQLKQGKAQLVRTVSAAKRGREKEEQDGRMGRGRGMSLEAKVGNTLSGDYSAIDIPRNSGNPFNDEGEASKMPELPRFGHSPSAAIFARRAGQAEGAGRPTSATSTESFGLPFVDGSKRALRDPLDRSPTDACARDSITSTVSRRYQQRSPAHTHEWGEEGGAEGGGTGTRSKLSNSRHASQHSSMHRQSSSSIGGLSVFDDIPFQIQGDSQGQQLDYQLPNDAHEKIQQAKERGMSASTPFDDQGNSSPLGNNPLLQHSLAQHQERKQSKQSTESQQEIMQAHPLAQSMRFSPSSPTSSPSPLLIRQLYSPSS